MWDQALLPLSPKGYSAGAMNENVTALTAIYLKCVTASRVLPARSPAAAAPGHGSGELVQQREGAGRRAYGGQERGGPWCLGKSIFHRREDRYSFEFAHICACLSEGGETQPNPILPLTVCLALFIPFLLADK